MQAQTFVDQLVEFGRTGDYRDDPLRSRRTALIWRGFTYYKSKENM
jgi:hypothetical protein